MFEEEEERIMVKKKKLRKFRSLSLKYVLIEKPEQ